MRWRPSTSPTGPATRSPPSPGGQQQRVLMARTLAGEPELLVLDEPNAGVDLANQEAIAGTLAGLAGAGATIVVVLHELGPFADLIQRTVVLREGRVVYDGPPRRAAHARATTTTTTGHATPPVLRPHVQRAARRRGSS